MIQAKNISSRLAEVMAQDEHNGPAGYPVRSLYFDTPYDDDYSDKCDGLECRRKIRLRCYDPGGDSAVLEMKQKRGKDQLKRSLWLPREDAEKIARADFSPLIATGSEFAHECYALMSTKCYRPKTIVEYDRLAFKAKENRIRITFDSNIRSTESCFDLFSDDLSLSPVFDPFATVLEVKYNGFLLSYIKMMLNTADKPEISVSKYVLARQHGYRTHM